MQKAAFQREKPQRMHPARRALNGFLMLSGLTSRMVSCQKTCPDQAFMVETRSVAMRILIVEDEPRLLRNLAKALREEGYAVDTADAGDDGLYKAESYNYDAIVLDIMLPRLNGWEVLERLRQQKQVPVLMLTARDAQKD